MFIKSEWGIVLLILLIAKVKTGVLESRHTTSILHGYYSSEV